MSMETTLAAELADDAAERLLRYVRIDTRSDEESDTYPSTEGQLDLLRLLRDELEEVGLADVTMDEHGYVTGTLPATVEHEVPIIALFAHVDTAREVSGAGVSPQRVRYEGGEIVLGDSGQSIQPELSPELENHVGHELITTDGTTLLGADDKAGVAEIMAAAAYLVAHPEIPHGTVKVAFNPDEEIGRGVEMCRQECRYFGFCGGGPPGNKYFENGTFASTETLFCRLHMKACLDVTADWLERHPPAPGDRPAARSEP